MRRPAPAFSFSSALSALTALPLLLSPPPPGAQPPFAPRPLAPTLPGPPARPLLPPMHPAPQNASVSRFLSTLIPLVGLLAPLPPGGRPLAPTRPTHPAAPDASAELEQMVMGELNKISNSGRFKQRWDQVKYWQEFSWPLMYLGLNNTGEVPSVPNQMAWWLNGNPFNVWNEATLRESGSAATLSPSGPLSSESHTCFGLMATWLAMCGKGPWYRTSVYDPYGPSGPEGDPDNSCERVMEQYTRLCHTKASIHDLSPFK